MLPTRLIFTATILVASQLCFVLTDEEVPNDDPTEEQYDLVIDQAVSSSARGDTPCHPTKPPEHVEPECGCEGCDGDPNAEFDECGDPCPFTCFRSDRGGCESCIIGGGCRCKEGFVRERIGGKCIKPGDCTQCGPNEFFDCGSACDTTCATLGEECTIQNKKCSEKCYCEEGYARDKNDVCIPIEECPPKCPKNEIFSECSAGCQKTCTDPIPGCNKMCVSGCVCINGYLRNSKGVCVPPELCDGCGGDPNAEYDKCGVRFPATCYKTQRKCTDDSCIKGGGCKCKKGFILSGDFGKCVKPCDCRKCGPNEVFDCGSACDTTCATLGEVCPIVNVKCTEMCYCAEGYARDEKNVCIPIKKCTPKFECLKNQKYDACPSDCPSEETCEDYLNGRNLALIDCPARQPGYICKPKCVCEKGYIRKTKNGDCIKPDCCCEDPNAEVVNCPNPCPGGTCESPEFFPCKAMCKIRGCQCKKGYVKDSNGKCILLCKCRKHYR